MNDTHRQPHQPTPDAGRNPRQRIANRLVFVGFLGIAAYYLLTEHRAHLVAGLTWLPWLLLACPLMHIFMHRGHAGHGSRHPDVAGDSPPTTPDSAGANGAKPDQPHSHGGRSS